MLLIYCYFFFKHIVEKSNRKPNIKNQIKSWIGWIVTCLCYYANLIMFAMSWMLRRLDPDNHCLRLTYFVCLIIMMMIIIVIDVVIPEWMSVWVVWFLFRSSLTMACSSAALRCVSNSVFTKTATLCLLWATSSNQEWTKAWAHKNCRSLSAT